MRCELLEPRIKIPNVIEDIRHSQVTGSVMYRYVAGQNGNNKFAVDIKIPTLAQCPWIAKL
jgi:hypothetical protein